MCDTLVWSFGAVTSLNWLEIIKTLASSAVAGIAFFALRNWQRQDKAKREAEFLDTLIEAVQTYIVELPRSVTLVAMAKIGMVSQVPSWEEGDEVVKAVKGAFAYIEARGAEDANRLLEALVILRPSSVRLRSLSAKGRVFKFSGYEKCLNAIATLTWQFDRMQAFATMIGSPTLNWENPEVLDTFEKAISLTADDIRSHVEKSNLSAIEFVTETYAKIYG